MQTVKTHGAILPGTARTMSDLEAPVQGGYAFLGGSGWLGIECVCGFVVSSQSLGAAEAALCAHQEPATCPAFAARARHEDEWTQSVEDVD